MSFPRYPEYKDSGVEWLGEVPAHWTVTKFSRHFAVRMGETIPESELIEDGLLPVYSATEKDKYYGYPASFIGVPNDPFESSGCRYRPASTAYRY